MQADRKWHRGRSLLSPPFLIARAVGFRVSSSVAMGSRHLHQGLHDFSIREMGGCERATDARFTFDLAPAVAQAHPARAPDCGNRPQVKHIFQSREFARTRSDDPVNDDENASRRRGILVALVMEHHQSPHCGGRGWHPREPYTRYPSAPRLDGHIQTAPKEKILWRPSNHAIVNNRFFTIYAKPVHMVSGDKGVET